MIKKIANKTALITALIITTLSGFFLYGISNAEWTPSFNSTSEMWSFPEMDEAYSDTAFGGIFASKFFNDSLPHYEYENKKRI